MMTFIYVASSVVVVAVLALIVLAMQVVKEEAAREAEVRPETASEKWARRAQSSHTEDAVESHSSQSTLTN